MDKIKIHIVCDHVYPLKNDPTGKMAYVLGCHLSKKYEIHFYSKCAFPTRNIENIVYHNFKCLFSYTA